jgi:hypothetical protein
LHVASKLLAGTFDGGDSQESLDGGNGGSGSEGSGPEQLAGGGGINVPAGVDIGGTIGVQGKKTKKLLEKLCSVKWWSKSKHSLTCK